MNGVHLQNVLEPVGKEKKTRKRTCKLAEECYGVPLMEIKSCIVHNCSSKLTEKTFIYEFEFSLNFFHLDSMQDL